MKRIRLDWLIVVTSIFLAYGCGGGCGGCSSMEPIPGGFPPSQRTANAVQVRLTQTGIAQIANNPAALLGGLGGTSANGVLKFNAPASCGGSTPICCPGGTPKSPCGPIDIDLNRYTGDSPRLVIAPASGASRLDVTIRARVKTETDLPASVPLVGECGVAIDTTAGSIRDIQIAVPISFTQDATAGTTRVSAGTVSVTNLETSDVSLNGGFGCALANLGLGFFLGVLTDQIASAIQSQINDQTCKACDSGNVAECGPFATACTNNVCMEGSQCLQELGLEGRLRGSTLFSSISPGTTGALDLYEVAGSYATTNSNGVALGLLGGMRGGGTMRDRCGPPATPPTPMSAPVSSYFQGNTRPDTGTPFDVGIGLHKSQLDALAYAGYDGGLFCLTIGSSAFAQLSTDTISLLSRSLGKLVETNSPMAVGLRPQSPPAITLGKNTFKDDGTGTMVVDQPLLDISFKGLEIDFFASIDEQWIRVFTVVADVHLPIGLQTTTMGELTPVLGNPADAFTNISVKNSEAITESPAELANLFPTLLSLVLPQLSGGLSAISLPALGGLALSVTSVTSVDNDTFLAIYANLVLAPMARTVDTSLQVISVDEPPPSIARDAKLWGTRPPPTVTLQFAGDAPNLEYSYRIDGGSWSAWSPHARETIAARAFWLAGTHKIEARARQIGAPETLDPDPAMIQLPIGMGTQPVARSDFHGQSGGGGCNCETGRGGSGAFVALVIALVLLPLRKLRRRLARLARLGRTVWLAAIACLPACNCGNPCGSAACLPGDVDHSGGGRWTSIAGDDKRVLVATYEGVLGDLVVVDATDQSKLDYKVVDGVPDTTPTHDPDSYRGGNEDAGPNVGAWTSIAMSGGLAAVAYQDRDEGTLKYAYETKPGSWKSYIVDQSNEPVGVYANMVFDADKKPAIAYLAVGTDDGKGHRNSELRIARGKSSTPKSLGDWTTGVITSAPGSCAGLCGSEVCVAGIAPADPQECVSPASGCNCAMGEACVSGVCRTIVAEPKVTLPPGGTGLYVSLVVLPDGRLAATYYDQTRRALIIAVESAKASSTFVETILDGNAVGADRGMWTSAVVGSDGTVHVAYQEALGDQLMYTTWNTGTGTPELVDDGQRPNDRTHPVGASGAIYLVGGSPVIAYQDGMTADVSFAAKGAGWTLTNQAAPTLDGFSIGVTTAHGGSPILAWGMLDPAEAPPQKLVVTKAP